MPQQLFEAIEHHDLHRLATLLARGADPNASRTQWPKFTALQAAINELEDGGPIEALALLLKHGADVNGWDVNRDATPLLMALFRGQREAVRLLLEAGADPNVRGGEGDSPVRWCVDQDDRDTLELLLGSGATRTINTVGAPGGRTALGLAAQKLNVPVIRMLRDAGADVNVLDESGRSAYQRLPPRDGSDPQTWDTAADLLDGPSR